MIIVIGKENCSACKMAKKILDRKGISYEYFLFENLDEEKQNEYMEMARSAGKLSMPIIIQDGKVVDVKEVK